MSKNIITNLVIGSEGFIGKSFCKYLEKQGEKVIRFDIKRNSSEDGRNFTFNFSNIDRVYFLAWDVGGAKYLYKKNTQLQQLNWNMELITNLMPQLEKSKKPFLFISSQLAEETDTVYGVTKRLGETWTKIIEGTFIRQWNVYGQIEDTTEKSHVISDFIVQATGTKEIKMLTTGEEKRQFVHIDDVCRAWHLALQNKITGIHDVTSFEWIKIIDLANIIAKLTGAKVIPGKIIGSTPMTPITGKVHGWSPHITIEEGLKKMIKTIKEKI